MRTTWRLRRRLRSAGYNFCVGIIAGYRPPHNENEQKFFSTLNQLVEKLEDKCTETLIISDLNYNCLDQDSSKQLQNFCTENRFSNTIFEGTRRNPISGVYTLLDVILCLCTSFFIASSTFSYPLSDHKLVISLFNLKSSKYKGRAIETRCLNKSKLDLINQELKFYFNHLDLTLIKDTSVYWSIIKSGIFSILDNKAPIKTKIIKPEKTFPWYDSDVLYLARKRNKVYFRAIKSKSPSDWLEFTKSRTCFKKMMRSKKANHYQQFISENSLSNSKLWIYVEPLINPNKKSQIIPSILLPEWINATVQDVANCFSNFFDSALVKFTFLSTSECISYIEQHFSGSDLSNNSNVRSANFVFAEISEAEVESALINSNENSSPGFVNIESKIIKNCFPSISFVFVKLFNLVLLTNEIPPDWKVSYVTPIYKSKGSKSSLDNYRPISVISPLAKIFKSLLAFRIRNYFENNTLLNNAQFGFRQNRSCEQAVNTQIELLIDAKEEKKYSIAVLLDLSKAFDTLDHELLLLKLSLYKFSENACKLIRNYIDDRFTITCFDGAKSSKKLFKVGVPQGSILGPLLFIIFINDICYLDIHSNLIIFVDDTTTVQSNLNLKKLIETVTKDLDEIANWLKHNKLILNVAKIAHKRSYLIE
jgi:hypothetical protein